MLSACGGDEKLPSQIEAKTTVSQNNAEPKGELKPHKSGGVSQDRLKIVSSIKPIQAIVMAIAGDHADVEQLIPDYASPHDYSFKPSDIRKMQHADIIFRIDEHMETQLNGAFDNIDKNKTSVVSLATANGLILLESNHNHQQVKHGSHNEKHHDHEKKGHEHDHEKQEHHDDHKEDHGHKHEEHSDHEHDDHSNHDNLDFHLWTSPKNAVFMAKQIVTSLSKLDAKNASQYQQNLEKFFESVRTESEKIAENLASYKDQPYIVFHNSWQYFAAEFGLQKPIVIDLHEGVSSGAKTIKVVRERIQNDNINCVFYDSSISLARLKVITETAKTVELNVLAQDIALDKSTYILWLKQFGDQIQSCLSK